MVRDDFGYVGRDSIGRNNFVRGMIINENHH